MVPLRCLAEDLQGPPRVESQSSLPRDRVLLGRAPPRGSAVDRYAQHQQEEEDDECRLKHPGHLATRRPCSICRMSRLHALHIQADRRIGPQSSRCNHAG
jgi:hypothetical protein